MQLIANTAIAMPDLVLAGATEFTTDTNVIDMSKFHRCLILLMLDQASAGTGVVTLKQSSDAAGSDEKALAFTEYWKNETGVSTSVMTKVTAATLTTAGPSAGQSTYAFEVKSDALDQANEFRYIRLDCVTLAGNTAAALLYIPYEPRYPAGDAAQQNAIA